MNRPADRADAGNGFAGTVEASPLPKMDRQTMKTKIRLLLAGFCLLSFGTGCAKRLDGTDDPDTGKNNAEVRTNKETQQADSLKDAENLARSFVDAMNRFFETDFEPMRQLEKDGFISDPLWAVLERAIQS